MHRHQPLPRLWMMTDERQSEGLLGAVAHLPEGAGIVFRHYSLPEVARRDLFERVKQAAPGLVLLAGPARQADEWGADGSHGTGPGEGLRSAPAHSFSEIRAAERNGAGFVFLSPAYPTRSHPDERTLGVARFAWMARRTELPVIALGGMNAERGKRLASFGAYGWAGVDAWESL
jgi:thiamine-phosphate pyrophosphorylase